MNQRARRVPTFFLIASVLLVLGVGVYVALGPYFTLKHFGEALAARDSAALAEYIDFPKLRQSIKEQVRRSVEQRTQKALFAENPISSLAAGLAATLSDPLVDSLVTPAGLETMLAGERLFESFGTKTTGSTQRVQEALSKASYSFKSLSTFSVELTPSPGMEVTLLLEREGLTWKIVGIALPQ